MNLTSIDPEITKKVKKSYFIFLEDANIYSGKLTDHE